MRPGLTGLSVQGGGPATVRQDEVLHLSARILPFAIAPGMVAVSSDAPAVASVPTQVPVVVGQRDVAIPVTGLLPGQTQIRATMGGRTVTLAVSVLEVPPALVRLQPQPLDVWPLQVSSMTVTLKPTRLARATTVQLASSRPELVGIPASVVVPQGQSVVSIPVQGLSSPSDPAQAEAQITAALADRPAATSTRLTGTVRVQTVPPHPSRVDPLHMQLHPGAVAALQLHFSAAPVQPTPIAVQTDPPGVVDVPASAVLPTGQTSVSLPVRALSVGQAWVLLGPQGQPGQRLAAAVGVTSTEQPMALDLQPDATGAAIGTSMAWRLRLRAAVPVDTRWSLSVQPASALVAPTEVLVPAGQTEVRFSTLVRTQLATGQVVELAASHAGNRVRGSLTVGPVTPRLVAVLPADGLHLQPGASDDLVLHLEGAAAGSQAASLLVRASTIDAPQSIPIPGAQSLHPVRITAPAGAPADQGQATVRVGLDSLNLPVSVAGGAPQLLPGLSDIDALARQPTEWALRIDRSPAAPGSLTLQADDPSVVRLPATLIWPAGTRVVRVPVMPLREGRTRLSAQLQAFNAPLSPAAVPVRSTTSTWLQVQPPDLLALHLQPHSLELAAGQGQALQATGTWSDHTQRTLSPADALQPQWFSTDPSVASVDRTGRVRALAAGPSGQNGLSQIVISQTARPLRGQPTPPPVEGQASVAVRGAGSLGLSTASTQLIVGQGREGILSLPYPLDQPLTVALDSQPAGVITAPGQTVLQAGQTQTRFTVQALTAGSATLMASGSPFGAAQLAWSVAPAVPEGPTITDLQPIAGAPGSLVTLLGTGLLPAGQTAPWVRFAGDAVATITRTEPGSGTGSLDRITLRVPDLARSGPITLQNGSGSAQSPVFTVQREHAFALQASPATLTLVPGGQASVAVSLLNQGSQPFEGLAQLDISGLPPEVSAEFRPARASVQQPAQLVLRASPSAAPTGDMPASLTVRAQATLSGAPWVEQATISLRIDPAQSLTGVQGRFVTPQGQGIAGVIVRHDHHPQAVVSDAAGNFLITGLPEGSSTLRFDATPAHNLYPIWPYTVALQAGELRTLSDWTIHPPPADEQFTAIANASADQTITDPRYPGLGVVLPAGVTITGWDGVRKTRIAVQRLTPDQLPVSSPPFAMKEAYQLYFGTPMGGIPSAPIPVTLPNVSGKEPGEKVDIWFFDGSPMGGSGEWKKAGQGTVSPDGQTVQSDPGAGLTRFCGVCGLVSLDCPPVPKPIQPPPTPPGVCPTLAGNPIDLYTGTAVASTSGPRCAGLTPLQAGLSHNPIDAYQNRAGTLTSFGWGWTFEHDVGFLPFAGPQKRLVLPGGELVDFVQDPADPDQYRPRHPRYSAWRAQASGNAWDVIQADGTQWRFEPFAAISGPIRGGLPTFLTRITDAAGNVTTLNRQSNGRLQSVQGSAGRSFTLAYGANGFVSELRDHSGRSQRFEYTAGDQPRIGAITDEAGRRTEYSYQGVPIYRLPNGQTACEADLPAGNPQHISRIRYPHSSRPTTNTLNTDRIVRQSSADGEDIQLAYRRVGACVVKVADEASQTAAFTCRAGQNLPSGQGLCPEVDDDSARAQGWRFYGGSNAATTVTRSDGSQTRTRFNAQGLPLEQVDEAGQRTRYQYSPSGQLVQTTDPLGRVTKYEHDALGNRTAVVNPLGQRVDTAFDPQHNQPSRLTRYLLGVPSQQGGQSLSYTPLPTTISRNAAGQPTRITDPSGQMLDMGYDSRGQLSRIARAGTSDGAVNLAYNAAGDLVQITDALDNVTRLGTDTLGRTTEVTDPLGHSSRQSYNSLDQPTEAINPLEHSTRLEYDAAGRTTAVINEAGVAIERYVHDELGRVIEVVDALNQRTRIGHDHRNRVSQITDRSGQTTRISYDERSQPIRIQRPDQTVELQYDAAGRLTEMRDNSSVISQRWDAADRLLQTRTTTAAGTHTLDYGYDSLGRMTQRTLSGTGIQSPELTTYDWGKADRLLSHTTAIGTSSHTTRYEYDSAGRLTARKAQSDSNTVITQRYRFDAADRLVQIQYLRNEGQPSEQLIEQIDYRLDAKGQRVGRSTLNGHGTGLQDTPFTANYDAANRMTGISITSGNQTRSYQLTHDGNGNLIRKQNTGDSTDTTTYRWDSNNRLIGISQPGLTAGFTYDALGRRIQSSITQAGTTRTVQYLYEGQQHLGEIRDGKISHRLLTGLSLDETIARLAITGAGSKDATGSRLYLTDALNSVIAQLNDDSQATLANSYAYSPFGESQVIGVDGTSNPVQYTSRENDGTGLMYYRARYRSPVGQWLSEDPAGFVDGLNKRGYVRGNPVSFADPLGLWSAELGLFVGVGASVSVGIDPDSGGKFMSIKIGRGLGWGAGYDPLGGRPGATFDQRCKRGVGIGVYGEAGASAGLLSTQIEASFGRNFFFSGGGDYYGGIQPSASAETAQGLKLIGSLGLEIVIFGAGE